MILIHGRGASAENILGLTGELTVPGFAFLAPQAAGHTWYPYSFLMPMERNEPYLSSALALLEALVKRVSDEGVPPERQILLGFSQGACLSTEFLARRGSRLGGVIGFSGGLIGPEGTPREYAGSLDGTAVFLGSSDPDPHIPVERVRETARILGRLGAAVDERIYEGMGHTVNDDELDAAVAEAYGWPWPMETEEILERLVALHDERVLEEKRGLVRWLRPDYQIPRFGERVPSAPEAEQEELETTEAATELVAWPDDAIEQLTAIRAAVAERALTVEEVARRFRGAVRADVAKHLETLEVLGVVSRLEGERWQVQGVGQAVAA